MPCSEVFGASGILLPQLFFVCTNTFPCSGAFLYMAFHKNGEEILLGFMLKIASDFQCSQEIILIVVASGCLPLPQLFQVVSIIRTAKFYLCTM